MSRKEGCQGKKRVKEERTSIIEGCQGRKEGCQGRKEENASRNEGRASREEGRTPIEGRKEGGMGCQEEGHQRKMEKNKIGKFGSQVPFYWGKIKVK